MDIPAPKYKIGDAVWLAGTATEKRSHPCPDCLGKTTWHVRSPAGGVYEAPCPRCSGIYQSNADLDLGYLVHFPYVRLLTVGSVRVDTGDENPVSYMCVETGVGGGSVYLESDLFASKAQAESAAEIKAKCLDQSVKWVKERYDRSVRFCDYELRPAVAAAEKERISVLQWKMHDLLNDLDACDDLEAVRERINKERSS